MAVFGNTDAGAVREDNQDYFTNKVLASDLLYSIVCDGMGGAVGGSIASKLATEYIESTLDIGVSEKDFIPKQLLVSAINNANAAVYNKSKEDGLAGMGTTAVVALLKENTLYCIYAGDSRLYKYNEENSEITQLTQDHTVVQFLLKKGGITPEQAKNHPQKHYITRALGVEEVVDADYFECEILQGDVFLLCTDGLYNYISPEDMIKKIKDSVELGTVRPLIDIANKNGGGDNITTVIIAPEFKEGRS